jgi:hypothetical protein
MAEPNKPRSTKFFVSAAGVLALGGMIGLSADRAYHFARLPSLLPAAGLAATSSAVLPEPAKPAVAHLPTPTPLKAIYMSQCVVGTPSFRGELIEFIKESELNAVVIDVKDYTGKLAFETTNPALAGSVSDACGARDMKSLIEALHEQDVYVIARITAFQDPHYTTLHPELAVQKRSGGVWKDRKGLSFVDVGARQFWDYLVEIGKETYEVGFDELNFDYVRFPSDGNMQDIRFTHSEGKSKPEALEEFFAYLSKELRSPSISSGQVPVLSADLFGMTTTNTDDLNIGQVLERALPYFDYIYPMVYPSHYPEGFNGYGDPNDHTYDIIKYSMDEAVMRLLATTTSVAAFKHERIGTSTPAVYRKPVYDKEKLRPWLQSFDYPVHYDAHMVKNQIQATYDAGLTSWIFWDPANKYHSLRAALGENPVY